MAKPDRIVNLESLTAGERKGLYDLMDDLGGDYQTTVFVRKGTSESNNILHGMFPSLGRIDPSQDLVIHGETVSTRFIFLDHIWKGRPTGSN